MSSRKYYSFRRPFENPSETNISDSRPAYLIDEPSETDMPDRWLIGDRHASSETDMTHRRPKCFIKLVQLVSDNAYRSRFRSQPLTERID